MFKIRGTGCCDINVTFLCLIVVGGYIAFLKIFHPQNYVIMTLPFYQYMKLGPTPTFYYQPPPTLDFFDFTGNKKLLRQDGTLFTGTFAISPQGYFIMTPPPSPKLPSL